MLGAIDKICFMVVLWYYGSTQHASFFNGHHCWDSYAESWYLC